VDLDDMKAAIDDKTKAIIINNPSNPCGKSSNNFRLMHFIVYV
jgi:aspartate/methionine/tyrosine aminotransferase